MNVNVSSRKNVFSKQARIVLKNSILELNQFVFHPQFQSNKAL